MSDGYPEYATWGDLVALISRMRWLPPLWDIPDAAGAAAAAAPESGPKAEPSSNSEADAAAASSAAAAGAFATLAACACGYAILKARRCAALRRQLERAAINRQTERRGRIAAERELRTLRVEAAAMAVTHPDATAAATASSPATSSGTAPQAVSPIGTFRSCFPKRSGTPRQPFLVQSARGRLNLVSGLSGATLEGLDQYSHAWLIFVFHLNTNRGTGLGAPKEPFKGLKAKVNVPRLDGGRMGVLATRSPHRPNAIGLSAARIERVGPNFVDFSGADLCDGTPILDVKPYVPFADSVADARAPEWVQGDLPGALEPLRMAAVHMTEGVEERIKQAWLQGTQASGGGSLYAQGEEVVILVREVLARDIRSVHQRYAACATPEASPLKDGPGGAARGGAQTAGEKEGRTTYHLIVEEVDVSYVVRSGGGVEVLDATPVASVASSGKREEEGEDSFIQQAE